MSTIVRNGDPSIGPGRSNLGADTTPRHGIDDDGMKRGGDSEVAVSRHPAGIRGDHATHHPNACGLPSGGRETRIGVDTEAKRGGDDPGMRRGDEGGVPDRATDPTIGPCRANATQKMVGGG
jgi:hypothetical protein